tara:strand:- start:2727 stop:3164 length:438 start_codon:yes stop_codon:yes gene_type:complete
MITGIFEILEEASKKKNQKEQIDYLRQFQDNAVLKTILAGAFYEGVKWNLPPGNPPFKPCDPINAESFLYAETKRLYLFCEGGPALKPLKREALFIEMLESVHPKDAEILLAMKNKKLPYKGITKALVNKAFPGLVEDEEVQEVS